MAYVPVPTRTTADANSAADINQLQDNIADTRATAGGNSFNVVDDADYTILDADGYTDIVIENLSAVRTITLPSISTNDNRIIRVWHGDLAGATEYKINITRAGSDTWENGNNNSSLTVPLMSPGDNMTIKADAERSKWDILTAHSEWRPEFFSYASGWTDHVGGVKLKREGFTASVILSARKFTGFPPVNDPWAFGDNIITLFSELRPPDVIAQPFLDNIAAAAYGLIITTGGVFEIQSANPSTGYTAQSVFDWRVE